MTKFRNKENEDKSYIFNINLQLTGSPRLEQMIERYLQETLENYFLEGNEKVKSLEITEIVNNRK